MSGSGSSSDALCCLLSDNKCVCVCERVCAHMCVCMCVHHPVVYCDKKLRTVTLGKRPHRHRSTHTHTHTQQLLPFLQAARKQGERASLNIDKLLINGQRFTSDPSDLRSLQLQYGEAVKSKSEVELDTKEEGPLVAFYGKHSVFSNFYLNPMEVSGTKYASNEHFYMVKKCEMSDKPELALRALRAKYPLQANAIG